MENQVCLELTEQERDLLRRLMSLACSEALLVIECPDVIRPEREVQAAERAFKRADELMMLLGSFPCVLTAPQIQRALKIADGLPLCAFWGDPDAGGAYIPFPEQMMQRIAEAQEQNKAANSTTPQSHGEMFYLGYVEASRSTGYERFRTFPDEEAFNAIERGAKIVGPLIGQKNAVLTITRGENEPLLKVICLTEKPMTQEVVEAVGQEAVGYARQTGLLSFHASVEQIRPMKTSDKGKPVSCGHER